jgi:Mg2+ and Co2+ transporter CorA
MHTWLLKTTSGVRAGGEELFDVWKSRPGSLLWLDIEGVESQSDREMLERKFGLAEADVEDALRARHPPAFEAEGERLFLLMAVTRRLSTYASRQQFGGWAEEYEDVAAQAERFNSLAELYQKVINDLTKGYISLNGHNLNQVMKELTVVTVIFLPLTLLVGIYSMNFESMPELKSAYGYFTLLGVMAFLSAGMVYILRRKH